MRARECFEGLLLASLPLLASCRRRGRPRASGGAVALAFYGDPAQARIVRAQLAAFRRARPDVAVRPIHIPSRYYTKLTVMFASGEAPDVFLISASDIPRLAPRGALSPLTNFLLKSPKVREADFHPFALRWLKFDGKTLGRGEVYALPRHFGPANLVFVNLDLLDRAGLPLPRPDWRLEDFLGLCRALKRALGRLEILPSAACYLPYLLVEALYQSGFPERPLDSRECAEAISKVILAVRRGLLLSPSGLQGQTAPGLFAAGRLAMLVSGSWELPKLEGAKGLRWEVLPFPRMGPLKVRVCEGPMGYAIYRKTSNLGAAWALVEFLASKEGARFVAEGGWGLPARLDLLRALEGRRRKVARMFLSGGFEVRPVPSTPSLPAKEFLTILREEVDSAIAGRKTTAEALRTASARLSRISGRS